MGCAFRGVGRTCCAAVLKFIRSVKTLLWYKTCALGTRDNAGKYDD